MDKVCCSTQLPCFQKEQRIPYPTPYGSYLQKNILRNTKDYNLQSNIRAGQCLSNGGIGTP